MKLALECPTDLLGNIQPLADFDWILTHLVLQDEEYAKFCRGSSNFKVLDNSVNELLEPCSLEDMQRAAEVVNPDLIVPPDYLGDAMGTMTMLGRATVLFGRNKLLPVLQGSSLEEAKAVGQDIRDTLGFSRIAIPYDIACSREDSPEEMAKSRSLVIASLPGFREFHLLGFTTIEEFRAYEGQSQIKSIDTGVPIMMGGQMKRLGVDKLLDKKEPTLSRMRVNNSYEILTSITTI